MRKPAFSFREIQARISCAIAQAGWLALLSFSATMVSGYLLRFCVSARLCVLRGQKHRRLDSHDMAYIMLHVYCLFACMIIV